MKLFLPILLFVSATSFAQSGDFIVLKKHGKTIQSFYSGSNISFTAESGTFLTTLINRIENDTLYLQEFIVQYLPTTFGSYIIDTVGSYHYKYHYNQVAAIGQREKTNFNVRGSGAALLGGGIVLVLGSGIVYLADREKFSAPLLIAGAGLGALGYFMSKGRKHGNGLLIGKKYKLVYMNMSNKKT